MITIVKSEFNSKITDGLLNGCLEALKDNGYNIKDVNISKVAGAFEIPAAIKKSMQNSNSKIVIALGCVIKGETDHYHYICDAVANGIMNLTLKSVTPILFGVLTCQNKKLALDRSGNDMSTNKGYELGKMSKSILLEEKNNDRFNKI